MITVYILRPLAKLAFLYCCTLTIYIIISGSDKNQVIVCKQTILKEFDIKDKGKLKCFFGLEIGFGGEMGIINICQKTRKY